MCVHCTVPVSLKQSVGCYSENSSCTADDSTCRVANLVSGMTEAKHELRECAAACRLANNLLFAKTVSMHATQRVITLILRNMK